MLSKFIQNVKNKRKIIILTEYLITFSLLYAMVELFTSGFSKGSIWSFIILCVVVAAYRLWKARFIYKNIVNMGVSMLLARDKSKADKKKKTNFKEEKND